MKIRKITFCAMVAAIYTVLTITPPLNAIAFGPIQFRISEVLCVLPFLLPFSTWGLFVGCILANLLGPNFGPYDIIFGSLATLLAGYLTSKLKKEWMTPLPAAVINGLVVGAVLAYYIGENGFFISFGIFGMQVLAGEIAVIAVLGIPLLYALEKWGIKEKFAIKS